ncbi:myosin-G heavy chain-like isoform X2 [Harmonia axyridis]|uniref:myosin-G heavy chain-like isoform X2 n=1 Tax=Harmonia axyridis TaxID=115357 RepID=UPI001E278A31|nr:myosin-G heavy chain-like isoform X2 [Harmonia axyridis]
MITMRSSSVAKMTKPPPPVPPRPSKTIVAEALAKRRRMPEDTNTIPVRSAPPPPPTDLSRSQSTVNFMLKRPATYDRSISDELKSNSRTLIFQSSNMKSSNNNVLVRKDSYNKKVTVNNSYVNNSSEQPSNNNNNNKVSSENDVIVTSKNILNSCDAPKENTIKISPDIQTTTNVTVNSQIVTCMIPSQNTPKSRSVEKLSASPTGTLGNTVDDAKRRNSFDEKWEGMLKDKNHVNKLIDEMFASVLEASNGEETTNNSCQTTSTTKVSTDSTTITINGCDNKYESTCGFEANGSTVLIIESGDSAKIESNANSLTKIRGSAEKIDLSSDKSNSSTMEKKSVKFDDKKNAEFLIQELESMRMEQEKIMKRQRKPSLDIYGCVKSEQCDNEDDMSNYRLNIVDMGKGATLDYDRLKTMSSLHGLPPLPKSLSGFNLDEDYSNPSTPARSSSMRSQQGSLSSFGSGHGGFHHFKSVNGASDLSSMGQSRKSTNLDAQLAILKREMI